MGFTGGIFLKKCKNLGQYEQFSSTSLFFYDFCLNFLKEIKSEIPLSLDNGQFTRFVFVPSSQDFLICNSTHYKCTSFDMIILLFNRIVKTFLNLRECDHRYLYSASFTQVLLTGINKYLPIFFSFSATLLDEWVCCFVNLYRTIIFIINFIRKI